MSMTRADYIKIADLYLDIRNISVISHDVGLRVLIYIEIISMLETYPNFNKSKFDSYIKAKRKQSHGNDTCDYCEAVYG